MSVPGGMLKSRCSQSIVFKEARARRSSALVSVRENYVLYWPLQMVRVSGYHNVWIRRRGLPNEFPVSQHGDSNSCCSFFRSARVRIGDSKDQRVGYSIIDEDSAKRQNNSG